MRRLLLAGLMAVAPVVAPMAPAYAQDWNNTFRQTAGSHVVGNPDAELELTTFVSYSCPHCASFEKQSDAALRTAYIHPGDLSLEVRHMIRNPIDLAAALVTECGPDDKFFGNHRRIMLAQEGWLEKAASATREQQQRWTTGSLGSRMRALAGDLGFYKLMEPRGYTRAQLDQCLSDEQQAERIAKRSQASSAEYQVRGTPSFVLNGQLLENVHTWSSLQQALASAKAGAASR